MLRGERRRRVQESIIATETSCALVGEEMAEMRERVSVSVSLQEVRRPIVLVFDALHRM